MRNKNVLPIIFTAKQIFLCLQHVENKGFQTVIKHRLKAIQKPIKNELGNREKNTKKCTFRFEKMHISFSRLYAQAKIFCSFVLLSYPFCYRDIYLHSRFILITVKE